MCFENGIMELPITKQPKEVGRTTNPNYYRYYRVISHPLEKCITLQKRIIQLVKDRRIILDLDDFVGDNHISAQAENSFLSWQQSPT